MVCLLKNIQINQHLNIRLHSELQLQPNCQIQRMLLKKKKKAIHSQSKKPDEVVKIER